MKILYGLYQPTSGTIYINGQETKVVSPQTAIKNGIGMVHQHFMLVPSFTVAENIFLGDEPRKNKIFMDVKKASQKTKELSEIYGLKVNPYEKVQDLSVGIQQRIEILKVLAKGADILILDEPTAVLTPQETKELFSVIKNIVNELGKTVILITHKLQEVLEISHRVSVMRNGKLVGTLKIEDATEQLLAEMMVGREVIFDQLNRSNNSPGKTLLEVENLKVIDNLGLLAIDGVSFSVREGEILGIAGVEGNGQSELAESISGLREVQNGKIYINGIDVTTYTPSKIRDAGLSHVPEDRLKTGLARQASVTENLILGNQHKKPYIGFALKLNRKNIKSRSKKLISDFDIRTPSGNTKVENLSGGNMQKLVVAREFSFESKVLLISQPTRGLDINAAEFIHQQIINMRNNGCAILLISADLDEIFRLSDRIITIYEGKITGEFKTENTTKQEIGLYMTGKHFTDEVV